MYSFIDRKGCLKKLRFLNESLLREKLSTSGKSSRANNAALKTDADDGNALFSSVKKNV